MALPRTLIDPKLIYLEPAVRDHSRGREVLDRFPNAKPLEVASHWKIPQLADPALAEDWLRVTRDTLVLGVKKGVAIRPNGGSADFIAPSSSNGCAMACAYYYVGRRKGYANPIGVFVNIEDITRALARHAAKLGPKTVPNTVDPVDWVYDLGGTVIYQLMLPYPAMSAISSQLSVRFPAPRARLLPNTSTATFSITIPKVTHAFVSLSCQKRLPESWTSAPRL